MCKGIYTDKKGEMKNFQLPAACGQWRVVADTSVRLTEDAGRAFLPV